MNIETLDTGATGMFVSVPEGDENPAVLIVHGWGNPDPLREGGTGHKVQLMLSDLGYHSFSLALRGHKPSAGNMRDATRKMHMEDVVAAYSWLVGNRTVNQNLICGFGTSYGGYMIAVAGGIVAFHHLVMRAPALYPHLGWEDPSELAMESKQLREWRETIHGAHESQAIAGAAGISGRLLVVASEHDEQMPSQVIRSYVLAPVEAHRADVITIPGAKHQLDGAQTELFLSSLHGWFQKNYPKPSTD